MEDIKPLRPMPNVDDNAAWEIEAYKLLLLDRELFEAFQGGQYTGWYGLTLLHFADIKFNGNDSTEMQVSEKEERRVSHMKRHALALVAACKRIKVPS